MQFALTDTLADSIVFAMENQNGVSVLDSVENKVVPLDSVRVDDDRYYVLPVWSSADGFELLRSFTDGLHSPLAREDLKRVLSGGRGVFRKFKDVIKQYPEVERRFRFFKDVEMRKRLMEWYNTLRESWGLEKLAAEEELIPDGLEDLVLDDFIFSAFNPEKDRDDVSRTREEVAKEYERQFPLELGHAVEALWLRQSALSSDDEKMGFICRSQSDDFTGCLLLSFCPSSAVKTVAVTDFFVRQDFRGLGIGDELMSKTFADCKERGIRWILISNLIVPDAMQPLLVRHGFDSLGSGYLLDVLKTV